MVACSGALCPYEWFHLGCMMNYLPDEHKPNDETTRWECPLCGYYDMKGAPDFEKGYFPQNRRNMPGL
jgi:hypothetical protein